MSDLTNKMRNVTVKIQAFHDRALTGQSLITLIISIIILSCQHVSYRTFSDNKVDR